MLSTNGTETVECPQLREALGYGCHFPVTATQSHSHKLGDFKEQQSGDHPASEGSREEFFP